MTGPTPRYPAAFINAIAEEGTKAEAVEWLQRTWNEFCEAKQDRAELMQALKGYLLATTGADPTLLEHADKVARALLTRLEK